MSALNDYMDAERLSDALLAEKVSCDRSMIAKVRTGKATPSLRLAVAISRETGVPVESLLPCEAAE
jgi:transcriptional regulator with XRE-family HTH domain